MNQRERRDMELKAAQELTATRQRERKEKRAAELAAAHALLAAKREADLEPAVQPREPKILVLDIETTPIEGYVWGCWEQNLSLEQIKQDWSILAYAAKWVGRPQVFYADTGRRGTEKVRDDSILLGGLWDLMNEAELVVAHNGTKFDIKKINWRLARAKYLPYSPTRTIDTLRVSRSLFAATSHKLGWLSQELTDTPKDKHRQFPGWELWLECLADNPKVWPAMRRYNVRDIKATEELYLRQRPWMTNHPNLGTYDPKAQPVCPKCASPKLQHDGKSTLQVGVYARYQCLSCGGWCRGKELLNSLEVRKAKLA